MYHLFSGEISVFFDKEIGKILDFFFCFFSVNSTYFSIFFKFFQNFDLKNEKNEKKKSALNQHVETCTS
jgi:hypothetical protein